MNCDVCGLHVSPMHGTPRHPRCMARGPKRVKHDTLFRAGDVVEYAERLAVEGGKDRDKPRAGTRAIVVEAYAATGWLRVRLEDGHVTQWRTTSVRSAKP